MFDVEQFSSWVIVALFFAVTVVVADPQPGRLAAIARSISPTGRARHGRPEPDFDDDPIASRRVARDRCGSRSCTPIWTDCGICVATDTYMSATRQLGNRLAYQQLRKELATLSHCASRSWRASEPGRPRTPATLISRDQRGPESLDVRWR